jgi:hypothetical protein
MAPPPSLFLYVLCLYVQYTYSPVFDSSGAWLASNHGAKKLVVTLILFDVLTYAASGELGNELGIFLFLCLVIN